MDYASIVLMIPAILVFIPTAVFAVEIFASMFARQAGGAFVPRVPDNVRLCVLVPAHNESVGIRDTLAQIRAQLRTQDRLLVVADNCTDTTASIASAAGVDVIVRNDPSRVGKGYALAFGLDHLRIDPPDVVIMIDADCRLASDALAHLAHACLSSDRPVQALNLMVGPNSTNTNYSVATFAFRLKNWARPLGLTELGLPCQMTGTGMALPWNIAASLTLAGASIVEDLKLSLDLVGSGRLPLFCPQAKISSQFPWSREGAERQRQRWERGHLGIIGAMAPRLIVRSLSQRNWTLLAAILDASIPPLTLLGFSLAGVLCMSFGGYLLDASVYPLAVAGASALALSLALLGGWFKFGRDLLQIGSLPSVVRYICYKSLFYRQIFSRQHGSRWVRADRDK